MGRTVRVALLLCASSALFGCPQADNVTSAEAQQALEESSVDSQAAALTSASFELSTSFTIGQAAEQAAQQVRDYVQSQLPCAQVTLQGATLSIEYGALAGNCVFHGHTFKGTHTITVQKNEMNGVVVQHTWTGFHNDKVSVTGNATVTWTLADPSRHVMHQLTWTRLSDGLMGMGSGDRTQKPLAGGITEGFEVDGSRSWQGKNGKWDLDINQVQMRWTDPAPQSGSFVLRTPAGKTITLVFERIDDSTIGVTASGGSRSVTLKIGKLGAISAR
ncbi:MAG: hypothetical protein ACHQ53_03535 [Polyangiales bacterium]